MFERSRKKNSFPVFKCIVNNRSWFDIMGESIVFACLCSNISSCICGRHGVVDVKETVKKERLSAGFYFENPFRRSRVSDRRFDAAASRVGGHKPLTDVPSTNQTAPPQDRRPMGERTAATRGHVSLPPSTCQHRPPPPPPHLNSLQAWACSGINT